MKREMSAKDSRRQQRQPATIELSDAALELQKFRGSLEKNRREGHAGE